MRSLKQREKTHQNTKLKLSALMAILSVLAAPVRSGYPIGTKISEPIDENILIEYIYEPKLYSLKFTIRNKKDGFLALGFNKKNKRLCPGDVVIISYKRIPKIVDGYCKKTLKDALPDSAYNGKNDWKIVKSSRETGRGWLIEARRSLFTADKRGLDTDLSKSIRNIVYAYHNFESDYKVDKVSKEGFIAGAKYKQTFEL